MANNFFNDLIGKLGSNQLLGTAEIVENVQNAVTELTELDSILTEIGKNSNLTKQQLEMLGDTAFETASKYGKSASDYLTGVQEMYRAGFHNAKEMAELSMLAQTAGDMEAEAAKNYLIASDAAYNLKDNVEELNNILDGQTIISNNTAVSMQDMAAATSEAASVASQCGVKMNELSALTAVAASKTRESGIETGNALKSIFDNLQNADNTSVTNVFDSLDISMTKISDGTEVLKTPIELLKELSSVYTGLENGSALKTDILSIIGGADYGNTLSAILNDWSAVEEMMNLYSQGTGSAAKEAEKSAATVESSLQKLSNTWTDTVENVADSDALRMVVNTCNGLLSVVNNVTDALGSMGSIGLGAGIFAGFKNTGKTYKCTVSNRL